MAFNNLADCCFELETWIAGDRKKEAASRYVSDDLFGEKIFPHYFEPLASNDGRPEGQTLYLSRLEDAVFWLGMGWPGLARHFNAQVSQPNGCPDVGGCEEVANDYLRAFQDLQCFKADPSGTKTNLYALVASKMRRKGTKWNDHAIRAFILGTKRKGREKSGIRRITFAWRRLKRQERFEAKIYSSRPPTSGLQFETVPDQVPCLDLHLIADRIVSTILEWPQSKLEWQFLEGLFVKDHLKDPKKRSVPECGDFRPFLKNKTFNDIITSGEWHRFHQHNPEGRLENSAFNIAGIADTFGITRRRAELLCDSLVEMGHTTVALPQEDIPVLIPLVLARLNETIRQRTHGDDMSN